MWKYVLAWFPMVAIAIANGMVREAWYGKYLNELAAHQISTLIAVILFGVYKYFLKLLAVTATLKAKSVAKGRMIKVGCRLKGSAR